MAKKDNKHSKLTINDRMLIQACIAKGESAASIAERIGFSVSTVYREIDRGSQTRGAGAGKCPKIGRLGICNFCGKRSHCQLERRYYDYEAADAKAGKARRESRSGTRISREGVAKLDSLSQQIRDTGSIHHVFVANKWAGEICCERTLRRLVYSGALSVKPHELRRYVRFKRDLPQGAQSEENRHPRRPRPRREDARRLPGLHRRPQKGDRHPIRFRHRQKGRQNGVH